MSQINAITVYCSASQDVDAVYFDAARELGRAIAKRRWQLVYGGNSVGLMDAVASAARGAGGTVVGVTPRSMQEEGICDAQCELIVTETMRERKALLEQRGDAFVTLPGGLGTLEEWFEIVVGRILGYHGKPVVLLNVNGYFDPLLAMIEHGIAQRFIRPKARDAFFVAASVAEAMRHLTVEPLASSAGPGPAQEPSAAE